MADERCRVTVVGARKQADVALPARAAIGEYVHSLAEICGQEETEGLPSAWSLSVPGRAPMPSSASLEAAGVTDGQLLYLCDLTKGEYDEPVVLELDERVAATIDRISGPRWTPGIMASVTLIASALWLVAGSISWLLTAAGDGALAGSLALGAGFALALAAWTGRVQRLGMTRVMRLTLALCAVPCWATAGWFTGLMSAGGLRSGGALTAAVVGLAVGAAAGALAALTAVPGIATTALAALAVAAGGATCLLVGFGATAHEVTAVVAVAGYGLVVLSPNLAGQLSALWQDLAREQDTESAVAWAHGLTLSGTVIGSVSLAIALALTGAAGNPFDIALAACLSCALLLRTGTCRFLAEATLIVAAGLTGLFSVAMHAPRYWGQQGWVPALAVSGLGLAMLILGTILTFGHSALGSAVTSGKTASRAAAPPGKREACMRLALTSCWLAVLPLAAGTFGIFGIFVSLGRHL